MIILIFIIGCAEQIEKVKEKPITTPSRFPDLEPGEWSPDKDTDCRSPEFQQKCDEFCFRHPQYCPGWEGPHQPKEYSRATLSLPAETEVSSLSRNYPTAIKCINEGPAIYQQKQFEIIPDETLDKIKETGFNTLQMLTINDCTGEKCVMDESSKILLLNDIVKAKQKGLAVWVATELVNAPPGSKIKLPDYGKFKTSYLEFCREIGELMEKYKVEYVTVNNEPDLFLQEQTQWGSKEQIDQYIIEIMPLANAAVKEKFTGKVINKITQPRKRSAEVLAASFKNVDIAGVDVGPPFMSYDIYVKEFADYQYYASLAEQAGRPWMNAEYWLYNYFETPTDLIKENQLKNAQVSFDAYLKTIPKGVGYTWNDWSSFSVEPNGEASRNGIKKFFGEIG